MFELYQSQRDMRRLRQNALQRGVIAVLDVGSAKVACLVLRFDGQPDPLDDGEIGSLAGQTEFRVVGAATTQSRGVQFGDIASMAEAERAIRTALQAAQKMAQVRVDHVIACFSGGEPRSYGLDGALELRGADVTEDDIARVLSRCAVPDYGTGREVLHAQPVNFSLDQRSGLNDPRGQMGKTLGVDMHMLTVDNASIVNLAHCIKRCDLELAGVANAAYMSGLSALVEDELELGAACIDMGGATTGLSIFIKKHMIYADTVRLGGVHVTSDIAAALQIPLACAERIKTFFGGVQATGLDDREMIELGGDSGDFDKDRRVVSRSELIGIMRPRIEEILEDVRARLDVAGFDQLPSQQIVLTGGLSQIPGLDAVAARILGQQVRLGRPLRVPGLPQAATGPAFAGAVGLAVFAAHPQDECWDFDVPMDLYPAHSLRRAVRWLRDNW